jgi:hypothetical protein
MMIIFGLSRCYQHLAAALLRSRFYRAVFSCPVRTAYGFENRRANEDGKKQGYDVNTDAEEHGLKASKGVKSTGVHRRGIFVFLKDQFGFGLGLKPSFQL